jgi:uncharacterized protein
MLFTPPLLLRNAYLQTVLPAYLKTPRITVEYKRYEITLRDGDIAAFYHYKLNDGVLCLYFHGLTGSFESNYMQRGAYFCLQENLNAGLVNFRGSGCVEKKSKRPYHSGLIEDLEDIMAFIFENKLASKIILIGHSLSANLILKYMATISNNNIILGAVAISPPCEIANCVKKMRDTPLQLFDRFFVKEITTLAKINGFKFKIDSSKLKKLKDVDEYFTAWNWGFTSADHYYDVASSISDLPQITINTHILTALDDPIVDSTWATNYHHKNLNITITKNGGHVGFLDTLKSYEMKFLDHYILRAIKDIITKG